MSMVQGFQRGFQAARGQMDVQRPGRAPIPFYVEPGKSGMFMFIDDEPTTRTRHFVKLGESFLDLTCLETPQIACPYCDAGSEPETISMFTVLELRKFVDRENRTRYVTRKPLLLGKRALAVFEELHRDKGGLKGWVVKAYRQDQKSARVGSTFDFQRRIEDFVATFGQYVQAFLPEKMTVQEYLAPIDWEEMYRPASPEEAARIARRIHGRGRRGKRPDHEPEPDFMGGGGPPAADAPAPTDDEAPPWA